MHYGDATNMPPRKHRQIPVPAQFSMTGAIDFFGPDDVKKLQSLIGRSLITSVEDAVIKLNLLSESYLVRYAYHRVPTPDSKAAEWCEALARDVGGLLAVLGSDDRGYPEQQMKLETRAILTNCGVEPAIPDYAYHRMKLGQNVWDVLDRAPSALWSLKQIARFAAQQYRTRSKQKASNASQPQNLHLLGAVADFLHRTYGFVLPNRKPNPKGPLFHALNFIRVRIMEKIKAGYRFTDHGTDQEAARRLQSFTPSAASSLWARKGAEIRASITARRR
jgi:hypothetical protein